MAETKRKAQRRQRHWGKAFRAVRLAKAAETGENWTRARVARAAGMTPTTYGRIEDGAPTMTQKLDAIADALRVDMVLVVTEKRKINRLQHPEKVRHTAPATVFVGHHHMTDRQSAGLPPETQPLSVSSPRSRHDAIRSPAVDSTSPPHRDDITASVASLRSEVDSIHAAMRDYGAVRETLADAAATSKGLARLHTDLSDAIDRITDLWKHLSTAGSHTSDLSAPAGRNGARPDGLRKHG